MAAPLGEVPRWPLAATAALLRERRRAIAAVDTEKQHCTVFLPYGGLIYSLCNQVGGADRPLGKVYRVLGELV